MSIPIFTLVKQVEFFNSLCKDPEFNMTYDKFCFHMNRVMFQSKEGVLFADDHSLEHEDKCICDDCISDYPFEEICEKCSGPCKCEKELADAADTSVLEEMYLCNKCKDPEHTEDDHNNCNKCGKDVVFDKTCKACVKKTSWADMCEKCGNITTSDVCETCKLSDKIQSAKSKSPISMVPMIPNTKVWNVADNSSLYGWDACAQAMKTIEDSNKPVKKSYASLLSDKTTNDSTKTESTKTSNETIVSLHKESKSAGNTPSNSSKTIRKCTCCGETHTTEYNCTTYKTEMCKNLNCANKDTCTFAHSNKELRKRMKCSKLIDGYFGEMEIGCGGIHKFELCKKRWCNVCKTNEHWRGETDECYQCTYCKSTEHFIENCDHPNFNQYV